MLATPAVVMPFDPEVGGQVVDEGAGPVSGPGDGEAESALPGCGHVGEGVPFGQWAAADGGRGAGERGLAVVEAGDGHVG